LTVKRTDTDSTFVQPLVGVGRNFLIAGQSNAQGLGTNLQTYSGTIMCSQGTEDHSSWRPLADQTDSDTGSGSIWPLLANLLDAADDTCPIGFITVADAGTGLIPLEGDAAEWDKATDGTSYLDMQARLTALGVNAIEEVLWHQGEAEVYNPATTEAYYAAMVTFLENIAADVPGAPRVRIAQLGQVTAEVLDDLHAIRQAQQLLWSHPLALPGPACYDVNLADGGGDSLHFKTDAELLEMANRWADCLLTSGPPVMRSMSVSGTTITIRYDKALATATLGTAAWSVTGSTGARTVSAATALGPLVTLTINTPAKSGETFTVIYANANTGQGITIPTGLATALPAAAQTLVYDAGIANPRTNPRTNPRANPRINPR
jgi:hypothetical protein